MKPGPLREKSAFRTIFSAGLCDAMPGGDCSDPITRKRTFDTDCDRVVVLLTRERAY